MELVLSKYGAWLETCRRRKNTGLQEWAFLLDLETKIYNSIITGDINPPEEWRQEIFQAVTRATLVGII